MLSPSRRRTSALVTAACVVLAACRIGSPAEVVEPTVIGVITHMEQVPDEDDREVTVGGRQLRILDPGLRRIAGPSLGVDRLLIHWETTEGPHFAVGVEEAGGCFTLIADAAYDTGDAIVFVWSEQPGVGVRLPKEPGYEPPLADPESRALILDPDINECVDADGVVRPRQ